MLEVGRSAVTYRSNDSIIYDVLQITIDIYFTVVARNCNGGINGG